MGVVPGGSNDRFKRRESIPTSLGRATATSAPIRKGSRWSSDLDSDCLFPREQGATGMNSSVLTASLTGRIQFFYCVALLRTTPATADYLGVSSPLVICFWPLSRSPLRRSRSGVNEGTSPRAPERSEERRVGKECR